MPVRRLPGKTWRSVRKESKYRQTMPRRALTDGFDLAVDALKLNETGTIDGVAGIPITYLARVAQAKEIRYVRMRHEQTAGHAAI